MITLCCNETEQALVSTWSMTRDDYHGGFGCPKNLMSLDFDVCWLSQHSPSLHVSMPKGECMLGKAGTLDSHKVLVFGGNP